MNTESFIEAVKNRGADSLCDIRENMKTKHSRQQNTSVVHVTLPMELFAMVDAISKDTMMTRSQVVKQLLFMFAKEHELLNIIKS